MPKNIQIDLVLPKIRAANIKQLLETFAAEISQEVNLPKNKILNELLEHEKEDSSAIGDGISIAHSKLPGLEKRFIALATLERPLSFIAPDQQPVDIACVLLSPESDGSLHLHSLSRLTRMLINPQLRKKLREARDEDTIKFLLIDPDGWLLAA